ncbi:glycoside hydrolase family 19 protein, partial [Aggregatibacter actinomycetemcomitans]
IADLGIALKGEGFDSEREAYYFHPLGMIGWLSAKLLLITPEMVNAVAPDQGFNTMLLAALNKYAVQYEINTPFRIAHFLAQCAHESGGFSNATEDDKYRRTAANNKSRTFRNSNSATKDSLCPLDQEFCIQPALFNYIYANSNGNGAENTGDGYKYRGGGYIQITGREKYRGYTLEHNRRNPNDQQNFEQHPELVRNNLEYSVESAMSWWRNMGSNYKDCNQLADLGVSEAELIMMSANVNGWYTKGDKQLPVNKHGIVSLREANGMYDRRIRFNTIKNLLGL